MAYDYSRTRRTAGQHRYHQPLVDIVDDVDGIHDAVKKHADLLLRKLTKLDKLVKTDPNVEGGDSNTLYGWKQQIGSIRESVERVQAAESSLGNVYDELNSWVAKWLPKDNDFFR